MDFVIIPVMDYGLSVSTLMVPAFLSGLLMFLAPCTLPLVPGYLAFISGVSLYEINQGKISQAVRRRVFINGVYYVLGFTAVFIVLGSLFGAVGSLLASQRLLLARLGGVLVIFFGLYLMEFIRLPKLFTDKRWHLEKVLQPGHRSSSFLFGATYAFGWTPCIGPILASVLLLASQTTTALAGAWLLLIFSLGMALPFLVLAWGIGVAAPYLNKLNKYLQVISIFGGAILVFMGVLMLTNKFGWWLGFMYQLFDFINYNSLLKYL